MNHIAEDILSYYGCGSVSDDEYLEHYGMPRRSGRYPWGSGDNPYQHGNDFISRVEELRGQNFTYTDEKGKTWTGDTAIAKSFGLSSTQFRTEIALAKDERRMQDVARAKSLKADGLGATEIGRIMGINESSVRSLLNADSEARMNVARKTADIIKEQVDKKGMVDVGTGVERELGVSKEMLNQALYILEREGYPVYKGGIPQATNPGQQTNQRVLCTPGTEHKDIYNYDQVKSLKDYVSHDGGETYQRKFTYPESLDSNRLMIRYAEDGGLERDGLVQLRPGKSDLSLGESRYSQVRIMVDGTKYIKGMAVYGDPKDFPDGVDVIFNTNKSNKKTKLEVLKDIKEDPDNPFGSLIKDADQGGQYWYNPKTGKRVGSNTPGAKLGLINKRADEGDWNEWKDALPSQFLSKQSKAMAKKQLDLAKADKQAEFDEISSLTNPTVKKHLLKKFADNCDSAAVNLQAAALPGQKYHVIIPFTSLKDNEVYAPNYENGSKLALIRYPHGGTFEIPILTVNNKNAEAKKTIGADISDAIGINSKVAERLSGADFDGDTVMCIPTHDKSGRVKITSTPQLDDLKDFDPKIAYPERKGMKYMKDPVTGKDSTQMEMGKISNLITDMTLAGADEHELARAVKHSMVVIDAGKHKLDYRQSEIDNNISGLQKKYQVGVDKNGNIKYGGAGTLISRAKGEVSVDKRQGEGKVNLKGKSWYDPTKPEGTLVYSKADDLYYVDRKRDKSTGVVSIRTISGKTISYNSSDKSAADFYTPVKRVDPSTGAVSYFNKDGTIQYRTKTRTQKSSKMKETTDAYTLVSEARHPMELIYADYANSMKAMARQARLEMVDTGRIAYNRASATKYKAEVKSLDDKLNDALLNATRERQAQRLAAADIKAKQQADPNMKTADIKKAGTRAITKHREEVGSVTRKKRNIVITDSEWEAIQAGAISENKLKQILDNTDIDHLRELATPRNSKTNLSEAKINKMKAMSSSNYSLSEIANALGVSTSTVSKYLKGVN